MDAASLWGFAYAMALLQSYALHSAHMNARQTKTSRTKQMMTFAMLLISATVHAWLARQRLRAREPQLYLPVPHTQVL